MNTFSANSLNNIIFKYEYVEKYDIICFQYFFLYLYTYILTIYKIMLYMIIHVYTYYIYTYIML